MDHEAYMKEALALATRAGEDGEVPVGAVVVRDGEVIGSGRNRREKGKNALLHAEIEAIDRACRKMGSWRLVGCSIYVTLEPCPMCAGAIINSRIVRVYYGAKDEKAGACGSVINLFEERFNHHPAIVGGIMADQCGEVLSDFFKNLR